MLFRVVVVGYVQSGKVGGKIVVIAYLHAVFIGYLTLYNGRDLVFYGNA